jgi:hypothetical protein
MYAPSTDRQQQRVISADADQRARLRPTRGSSAALFLVTWYGSQASTALACPDCSLGRLAWQQVWAQDFALNLTVALAPFLVVVAACLWAEAARE